MTDNAEKKTHIEISYKENGWEITAWYAVSPAIIAAAEKELFSKSSEQTAKKLVEVLYHNGAVLDRDDGGPACVKLAPNGSITEMWCRNNKLDRDDGPALVYTNPHGFRTLSWFHDGMPEPVRGVEAISGVKIHPPKP